MREWSSVCCMGLERAHLKLDSTWKKCPLIPCVGSENVIRKGVHTSIHLDNGQGRMEEQIWLKAATASQMADYFAALICFSQGLALACPYHNWILPEERGMRENHARKQQTCFVFPPRTHRRTLDVLEMRLGSWFYSLRKNKCVLLPLLGILL